MVQEQHILLSSYARPLWQLLLRLSSGLRLLEIFELKEGTVRLVQNICQYMGKPHKDPHKHLMQFVDLSENFQYRDVPDNYVKLSLFPLSLIGEVRDWLTNLPASFITSWELLSNKFIDIFFSPKKTKELRGNIVNFTQRDSEYLSHAWERYKAIRGDVGTLCNLLTRVLPQCQQIQPVKHILQTTCESCGEAHAYINCPQNPESVNYVGPHNRSGGNQGNYFGNNYNQQYGKQDFHKQKNYQKPQAQIARSSVEDMMK
ncbi:uncharacterized protein LOC132639522 [Lycium barbarum]|uniref:uncharacterized protein LOC132639522 n=1 Tax=Lycium barbarum TaxID=112863 RepID=UPI00293F2D88|nr:uncharacterized protein LOC132639522 [Lycium barbarum]